MRQGLILAAAALAVCVASTHAAAAANDVTLTVVKKLFKDEGYSAHLFHDGQIWEGEDFSPTEQYPHIFAYSADGTTLLADIRLQHSPSYVYPYGPHAVLVVGKAYTSEWFTYFTVIQTAGFGTETTTLPSQYQVDRFAGDPDHLYFTEPGDSAIYQYQDGDVRTLGVAVAAPEQLAYTPGAIFVIKQPDILQLGHENVIKIDLNTEVGTPTFQATRNGLVDLISLDGGARIATSEYNARQVLILDAASNSLTHVVPVNGHPFGLAQLGHCVVAVTDDTKKLEFIDLNAATPAVAAEWDLSSIGLLLKQPRSVSVDPATGRVYVRSNYVCPSCDDTMSSVVMAEQASHAVFNSCTH